MHRAVCESYACARHLVSIQPHLNMATMTLKMDSVVKDTFDVIVDFLDGMNNFINVLSPKKG